MSYKNMDIKQQEEHAVVIKSTKDVKRIYLSR